MPLSLDEQIEFDAYAMNESGKARTQAIVLQIMRECRKKCVQQGPMDGACERNCASRYLDIMVHLNKIGIHE